VREGVLHHHEATLGSRSELAVGLEPAEGILKAGDELALGAISEWQHRGLNDWRLRLCLSFSQG
jgi:hypothetical protein